MATSQVIIGYSVPTPPAKLPLDYIVKRLCHDTKVTKPKKYLFFDSSETGKGLFGNLFTEKEKADSIGARIYDKIVGWYRWFQDTPLSEMFQLKSNQNNMIHPINE